MEADEFYEYAKQPEFPDEMGFDMECAHGMEDRTFSQEGVENMVDHMHDFMMARIVARWKRTGRAPQKMRIVMRIDWDGSMPMEEMILPWFAGYSEHGGLTQADGQHRVPRTRRVDKG